MSRFDRQYLAGRYAAQEARKEARAGDFDYATQCLTCGAKWSAGTVRADRCPVCAESLSTPSAPEIQRAKADAATGTEAVHATYQHADAASSPPFTDGGVEADTQRHTNCRGGQVQGPARAGVAPGPSTPYERDVQAAVLELLRIHPRVAWAERMNVGGMENASGQYVRFGFRGLSDIIGQLKDGRFLAVECKRPGKVATADQWEFLCKVQRNSGFAIVASGVDDVMRALA